MKLNRRQLSRLIIEAGIIPSDVLEMFISGEDSNDLPRLHVTDVHEVPDDLEDMDPHEAYGLGYEEGKDMQYDHPDWSAGCVRDDEEDYATPGEALGLGYNIGKDEDDNLLTSVYLQLLNMSRDRNEEMRTTCRTHEK